MDSSYLRLQARDRAVAPAGPTARRGGCGGPDRGRGNVFPTNGIRTCLTRKGEGRFCPERAATRVGSGALPGGRISRSPAAAADRPSLYEARSRHVSRSAADLYRQQTPLRPEGSAVGFTAVTRMYPVPSPPATLRPCGAPAAITDGTAPGPDCAAWISPASAGLRLRGRGVRTGLDLPSGSSALGILAMTVVGTAFRAMGAPSPTRHSGGRHVPGSRYRTRYAPTGKPQ